MRLSNVCKKCSPPAMVAPMQNFGADVQRSSKQKDFPRDSKEISIPFFRGGEEEAAKHREVSESLKLLTIFPLLVLEVKNG